METKKDLILKISEALELNNKLELQVCGNTFPHKEKIKKLGYKWNGIFKSWTKYVPENFNVEEEVKLLDAEIWNLR